MYGDALGFGATVTLIERARDLGKPLVVAYFEGLGHMVSLIKEPQGEARQRGIAFLRDHLMK